MNSVDVASVLRETLFVAVKVGAPALLASMAAGLLVSIFQAVTQINESTLAFLPKFLASMAALLVGGPFMYGTLVTYTRHVFDQLIVAGGVLNPDLDQFIATLPTQAVIFIAILARVAAMFVAFPAFMFQSTPTTVRAAMAIGVSLLLFPLVQPQFASAISDDVMVPARLLALLCSDFLSGALIGWLAQLMMLSFPISIQIMSTFIGISNVLQPDPELGAQSTPLSHLAQLSITLIVFSSSLYVFPLNALVGSYQIFPPGHFPFLGDAAKSVAKATEYSFFLAFQLAMPVVLIGTIWPIMLGLLSRFSPGLQVYNLAMPAQLLGGIFLLALLLKGMLSVWTHAASAGLVQLPGYGLFH